MKRFVWFPLFWSVCLCALSAGAENEVAQVKSFSSIGKERPDLKG